MLKDGRKADLSSFAARLLAVLVCFLIILAAGCGKTNDDWRKAEADHSIQAYEQFLARHPNGRLAAAAKLRIQELTFADVEAHETPQAWLLFIAQYAQGPLVEKAKRRLEDLEYREAEAKGTVGAFDEFVRRYPGSEWAAQAKAKIENMAFEQAEGMNTFASYRAFLEKFGNGPLAEKAGAGIAALKSRALPQLRNVKTLGLRVRERYSQARDAHVRFDEIVKRVATYADLEFVGNEGAKTDARVEIDVSGEPLGALYGGKTRYFGAEFSGTVVLRTDRATIGQRSFSASVNPPNITIIQSESEGTKPGDAPFAALVYREGSFFECFLDMMGRAFGSHVLVPCLKDEDTATTERVVAAIVSAAGPSAYDIFEKLSKSGEPHLEQAAMTGFGKLRSPRALGVLEKAVETESVVGWKAAQALTNMGWTPPNADMRVRYFFAMQDFHGLKQMGPAALEPLLRLLKSEKTTYSDRELKVLAARYLRVLNLKQALPPMIDALADRYDPVRVEAAAALGVFGDRAAVPALIRCLDDAVKLVRMETYRALGDLKDARAVEPLIKHLATTAEKDETAEALAKITRMNFGRDVEKWQKWWDENKPKDIKQP
jgi:outer membrane protein assembly factor BamD (BamD/ComL family)